VLSILSPFAGPIFWGLILAFTFYPFYTKLLDACKQNANFASGAVTALALLALTPVVIFVVLLAARETVNLYDWLTAFIRDGGAERLYERIRSMALFRRLESLGLSPWESLGAQSNQWLLDSAGTIGNFVLKHLTLITKNVIAATLQFFLTFFLLFFFLRDGEKIYRFIYEVTPLEDDSKSEIFGQLSETFSATLRGQLFTSIAQATVLGIVFWVMGLPLPVFFAGVAFLASMIPVVGVSAVWVPFALYLFASQEFARGGALVVLGVLVISSIDNILKPLLIGHKTKLPYSLLFLGILGGIQVYGVMGIFLAPAVLSLFFVLIKIYRSQFSSEIT
jgi:predicted PurR-regulated permease PerM